MVIFKTFVSYLLLSITTCAKSEALFSEAKFRYHIKTLIFQHLCHSSRGNYGLFFVTELFPKKINHFYKLCPSSIEKKSMGIWTDGNSLITIFLLLYNNTAYNDQSICIFGILFNLLRDFINTNKNKYIY